MVKTLAKAGPNILDILEVIGLVPPTRLGRLLLADKHHNRVQLRSEAH